MRFDADMSRYQTAGLLAERLQAWKHAVGYLEEYVEAVEKIHRVQAKEYEKALKVCSAATCCTRRYTWGFCTGWLAPCVIVAQPVPVYLPPSLHMVRKTPRNG